MKLDWGYKLTISLIVFAGIMATMVTIAMRQNIDLVDKEYYKKELAYQEQIDKISNAVDKNALQITFDEDAPYIKLQFREVVNDGKIHLFRPSDASEDKIFAIGTDGNGLQKIPFDQLSSGLWRIKIDWSKDGEAFYHEQQITIP
jgi:hypothetical protein